MLSISLILISLLILSVVSDYFITKTLRKSKDKYYSTWNDLVGGKINSTILIYGSSRARAHVNTKILEDSLQQPVYNLGIDSYNFKMQYCRHQLILQNNNKPAYIIQTLDYATLGDVEGLYEKEQFLPYFDNEIITNTIKTYKGFNEYDYHLPLLRYYGCTKQIVSSFNIFLRPSHNKGNRYKGFYNFNQNWTYEFEKLKLTTKELHQEIKKNVVVLFDKYLADLKKKNIKVIFVYTPEYIEGQKFIANRAEIMKLYTNLALKYNIPFIDYSSDTICLNRKYFYNAEHLNLEGANLFSKKLATDLKRYIHISK